MGAYGWVLDVKARDGQASRSTGADFRRKLMKAVDGPVRDIR